MATNFPVTAGFSHEFYADNSKAYNYEIYGIRLQQNRTSINFLSRLLEEQRPDNIIEIGTYTGGLSLLFGQYGFLRGATVDTFDIADKRQSAELMDAMRVRFHCEDCFHPHSDAFIRHQISDGGRSFVFCDGGNKIREFNYYADLIKSGDIICCHDYAQDQATFEKSHYLVSWGWMEIQYSDIAEAVARNGLKPVFPEIARNAALGVFIKP